MWEQAWGHTPRRAAEADHTRIFGRPCAAKIENVRLQVQLLRQPLTLLTGRKHLEDLVRATPENPIHGKSAKKAYSEARIARFLRSRLYSVLMSSRARILNQRRKLPGVGPVLSGTGSLFLRRWASTRDQSRHSGERTLPGSQNETHSYFGILVGARVVAKKVKTPLCGLNRQCEKRGSSAGDFTFS